MEYLDTIKREWSGGNQKARKEAVELAAVFSKLRPGRNLIRKSSQVVIIKMRKVVLSFQPYHLRNSDISYLELLLVQNQKARKEAVDLAAVFSELILI